MCAPHASARCNVTSTADQRSPSIQVLRSASSVFVPVVMRIGEMVAAPGRIEWACAAKAVSACNIASCYRCSCMAFGRLLDLRHAGPNTRSAIEAGLSC